ncbi:MAG: EthD family reductase [Chloroflexi bacterium]|nr:EthD family reductase [Chloroflexota bacterium]
MTRLIILLRTREAPYGEQYNKFLMLVEDLPGLRRKAVSQVYAGPGGPAPFEAVIELTFDDREALREALSSEVGVEAGNLLLRFGGPDSVTLFADTAEEDFSGMID